MANRGSVPRHASCCCGGVRFGQAVGIVVRAVCGECHGLRGSLRGEARQLLRWTTGVGRAACFHRD